MADAITTFARSNAPTLDVHYGSLASAWPFGLVALVLLVLSRPLFRVRVLAEPNGALRVERSLLGIWSRQRRYPLDGVRSVKVVSELPKEIDGPSFFTSSDNWFVLLERTGGVVLLDDWNTRKSAPSEALCAALREHLSTLG